MGLSLCVAAHATRWLVGFCRAVTRVLLQHDFGLLLELPLANLCPPVGAILLRVISQPAGV